MNLSDKKFYQRWGWGIFIISLIFWSQDILWAFSNPFKAHNTIWFSLLLVKIFFFYALPLLIVINIIIFVFDRQQIKPFIVIPAIFVLINFLMMVLYYPAFSAITEKIQVKQLAKILNQNDRIVEAIRDYEDMNGISPQSLDDLVPEYLIEIPEFLDGHPVQYSYEYHPTSVNLNGNEWILNISFPLPLFKNGYFFYVSDGIFPDDYKNFGNWIFFGIY